jgi:hypothetical protein
MSSPSESGSGKDEVVYFVAVRTSKPQNGIEIQAAMKALNEAGLLAQPPLPDAHYAVAWYRPYEEITANDNGHLRALGLDFDDANRIATVAWENTDA